MFTVILVCIIAKSNELIFVMGKFLWGFITSLFTILLILSISLVNKIQMNLINQLEDLYKKLGKQCKNSK